MLPNEWKMKPSKHSLPRVFKCVGVSLVLFLLLQVRRHVSTFTACSLTFTCRTMATDSSRSATCGRWPSASTGPSTLPWETPPPAPSTSSRWCWSLARKWHIITKWTELMKMRWRDCSGCQNLHMSIRIHWVIWLFELSLHYVDRVTIIC